MFPVLHILFSFSVRKVLSKRCLCVQACCVEYITLVGDSLAAMFPGAHLNFWGLNLNSEQMFALTTAIAVLPTVWLRNLSLLSYLSGDYFCKEGYLNLSFQSVTDVSLEVFMFEGLLFQLGV